MVFIEPRAEIQDSVLENRDHREWIDEFRKEDEV